MGVRTFVDAVVVATVLSCLVLGPRVAAGRHPGSARSTRSADSPRRSPTRLARSQLGTSPLAALGVVTALIFVNQILFTVHVLRVHGGDPSFIARYLPPGWFETATDNTALRTLAEHFPAPGLLAPSVLRVQAFLELPFVLLAFGTVMRWLDAELYRRVARSALLPLASVSYTAVFCLVEWGLRSPYTVDDIVVRSVSAVLTPLFLAWLAGRDTCRSRTEASVPALLVLIASLGALGALVLVVYDTALLYNLGRLGSRLPAGPAALAVLGLLRLLAARLPARPSKGPTVVFLRHVLGRWLVLFFVPALAVRYGVVFGTPALSVAVGLLLLPLAATALAARDTLARASAPDDSGDRPGVRPGRLLLTVAARITCAVPAGGAVAYVVTRLTPDTYYEATLLPAAAAFLVVAVVTCGLLDAMSGSAMIRPGAGDVRAGGTRTGEA